jgi:hypothetical protein
VEKTREKQHKVQLSWGESWKSGELGQSSLQSCPMENGWISIMTSKSRKVFK